MPPGLPLEGDGEPVLKRVKPEAGSSGQRFADFWAAWPKNERKQDKAKCLAKWKLSRLDLVADMILADITTKRKTQKWIDGYCEAPLVYLNGKRWEDGVQPQEPGQEAKTMAAWHEIRSGVEKRARELGVFAFGERTVDGQGRTISWPIYRDIVMAADQRAQEVAA